MWQISTLMSIYSFVKFAVANDGAQVLRGDFQQRVIVRFANVNPREPVPLCQYQFFKKIPNITPIGE